MTLPHINPEEIRAKLERLHLSEKQYAEAEKDILNLTAQRFVLAYVSQLPEHEQTVARKLQAHELEKWVGQRVKGTSFETTFTDLFWDTLASYIDFMSR
jgi:hypothetical protein